MLLQTAATAVALCKEGKGVLRVNGQPIGLTEPRILAFKVYEPVRLALTVGMISTGKLMLSFSGIQVLVLKPAAFANVDIRVRVSGGGHASQVYAIRQAIGKAIVAYTAKYEDAAQALELKKALVSYDRTLLVADPRRCEPKKFGGPGQWTYTRMASAIRVLSSFLRPELLADVCYCLFAVCRHLAPNPSKPVKPLILRNINKCMTNTYMQHTSHPLCAYIHVPCSAVLSYLRTSHFENPATDLLNLHKIYQYDIKTSNIHNIQVPEQDIKNHTSAIIPLPNPCQNLEMLTCPFFPCLLAMSAIFRRRRARSTVPSLSLLALLLFGRMA